MSTLKIFKLPNALKLKMGIRAATTASGHIDPKMIAEADSIIGKACEFSGEKIGKTLEELTQVWEKMRAIPQSKEREELSSKIFTLSHEIKDIGSLCGYALIAYFAESLRDYIANTALNLKNQQIIIQAHVDAMNAAHKNKLRENGGPAAEELKRIVKIAIEKYH